MYDEEIEVVVDTGAAAVAAVGGLSVISSLFMSQVIQYLWGIINSLQMIVFTVLFTELLMP